MRAIAKAMNREESDYKEIKNKIVKYMKDNKERIEYEIGDKAWREFLEFAENEKGRAAWAQDWVIFTIAEVFEVNLVILRDFDEDFYTLYSNYDIINPDWNTIVIKHGGNHFKALKWKISDDELEKEISEEFKEIYGKFEVECRNIWLNLKFGAAVSTKQLRDGYRRAIDQLDLEWKRIKEKKDERMEVDDNIQDP